MYFFYRLKKYNDKLINTYVMKTFELNNVLIKKNIQETFNILCVNDNNIVKSNVSDIVDWKQYEWENKKGIMQQKDIYTFKIDKLPELYYHLLDDNSKLVKVEMLKKLIHKSDDKYVIRIKYKILNLKPLIKTIVNKLQLIKMKCNVQLYRVDENNTKLTLKSKASAFVPYSSEIEEFIIEYTKTFLNTILQVMQK